MTQVFRIRTAGGKGWVREIYDGSPIITGSENDAETWPTRREASQVAQAAARRGHLSLEVVAGEPLQRWSFRP